MQEHTCQRPHQESSLASSLQLEKALTHPREQLSLAGSLQLKQTLNMAGWLVDIQKQFGRTALVFRQWTNSTSTLHEASTAMQ
jgi:hypothetical protein